MPYNSNKLNMSAGRHIPSSASIEEELEERLPTSEYIANLRSQCQMRENALKTAESLITAYQKENEGLREELRMVR